MVSTPKDKVPEWAHAVLNKIEAHGFTASWEPLFPIPPVDGTLRVQIRNEARVGQAREVARYAEAMKRGEQFPPGVITSDGRIVDFNTRQRAALKLGWLTFPTFVLDQKFEGSDPVMRAAFTMLAASFNTGGPKPLTRVEITDIVRMAAATGEWDTNKLSQDLGITRASAGGIMAGFRAEKRAELLGVTFNGTVSPSTRAMLGGRSEKLNDEPFREAVRLIQDAGLTGDDASHLVKRVVDVTSGDNDRLTLIAKERDVLAQAITKFKASGKKKPPLSIKARTSAEFFAGAKAVDELVDANPNTRDESLVLFQKLAAVASELAAAQAAANNELVEVG